MFDEPTEHHVPDLTSSTSACIADTCAASQPTERNSQLCVLSSGLDLESVAVRLIDAQRQHFCERLFLVVLPDGVEAGTTAEIASTLTSQFNELSRSAATTAPVVHAMEEGSAVKNRCLAYQEGGVVVIASRMLCADILHKRVSLAVVGLALVLIPFRITRHGSTARRSDAITPSLAFSVELFLRSAGGATARGLKPQPSAVTGTTTATDSTTATVSVENAREDEKPSLPRRAVILLSDNPSLMQYLAQRHQVGSERFIQQMRIGDIQLFPRFRLNLVQHFEKLTREKPLHVERVTVNVSTSILILDDLLQKILREVLSELQAVERRLTESARMTATATTSALGDQTSANGDLASTYAASGRRSAMRNCTEDDGVPQAFQPRARLQHDTVNGKLDYTTYNKPGSGSGGSTAQTEGYMRRPWRPTGATSAHRILFSAISEDVLLDMESNDLDADVGTAHDVHDGDWPYRALCESLIDVRWLRRALWAGTCYDFIFALERCLERRQRRSERQPGAPPPPAALWTLSSHFHDVVTVATHRIGDVVLVDEDSEACARTATTSAGTSAETVVVGDDENDEEDADVAVVGMTRPPRYQIVPSSEEQDYAVEVAVRLAKSWCRDVVRKSSRHVAEANVSGRIAPPLSPLPAFLILVDGSRSMVRLMERLLYSSEAVRGIELNNFLRRYQHRHGVFIPEDRGTCTLAPSLPSSVNIRRTADTEPLKTPLVGTHPARRTDSPTTPATVREPSGSTAAELLKQWQQLRGDSSHDDLHASSSSADNSDDDTENAEGGDGEGQPSTKASGLSRSRQENTIGTTPGSSRAATQAESGSVLFGNQKPNVQPSRTRADTSTVSTATNKAPPPSVSLHQLLLTQAARPLAPFGGAPTPTVRAGEVCGFSLERIQKGAAVLIPQLQPSASTPPAVSTPRGQDCLPRVVVAEGSQLTVTDLMAFLTGQHHSLRRSFFSSAPMAADTTATERDDKRVATEEADCCSQASPTAPATCVVQRVMVLHHTLRLLRQLEICQETLPGAALQTLRVQLVTSTFTDANVKKALVRERQSFAALAHIKATLTGTLLMDHASLRDTETMLENGLLFGNKRRRISRPYVTLAGTHVRPEAHVVQPPLVVFDEREFRSSLPYALYARGIDLVPLTLTTADYIISPEYGVERKSVRDFTQSLTSGRIYHQLAALSRKYAHPLCLIEFNRTAPFRLVYSSMSKTSAERSAMTLMYARVARVATSYPRVSWIWSRSPAHSAAMFAELKRTAAVENVDPSDPSLTSGASNWAEVGGTASPGEAASYAARVLSRFPGITPQNAPKVMQLCGSLAGLATVSKASLLDAIGESDGESLYTFLHTPWDTAI